MQHSFYKYFSKPGHVESLLEGQVFFRTLRYFTDYEDDEVRGDPNEGTHLHAPKAGLEINNLTQGQTFVLSDRVFKSSVKQGDIFVFCVSMSRTEALWREFKSVACVEIRKKREFLQRVRLAVEAIGDQVYSAPVEYRDPSSPPKHEWALPEKVCMSKMPTFKHQDEYRIAFGKPEIFAPNHVETIIADRNHRYEKRPDEAERTLTIDIGSIRDLCMIHRSI
jgi:hypothetical protein